MIPWLLVILAAGAAAGSTGLVTRFLRQRAILDHPNARSSHVVPTPRGGGWGILLVVVPAWAALGVNPWLLAGIALLAAVSWIDDRHDLAAAPRLLAQTVAVATGLIALGDEARVFQGLLPGWLDHATVAIAWLWFINLFNFMDGIDGLAGSEAVSVAGGLALATTLTGTALGPPPDLEMVRPAAVLAGAALGFLAWNWQPAKVFMGDVGSVPMGFALGGLLFAAAANGLWLAALLLPLYFVTDATLTLLRRLFAGQRLWQAHREHAYQRAVQSGWSHAQVVRAVLLTNAGLVTLALAAPRLGWPVLAAGATAVLILLWRLGSTKTAPVHTANHHEDKR